MKEVVDTCRLRKQRGQVDGYLHTMITVLDIARYRHARLFRKIVQMAGAGDMQFSLIRPAPRRAVPESLIERVTWIPMVAPIPTPPSIAACRSRCGGYGLTSSTPKKSPTASAHCRSPWRVASWHRARDWCSIRGKTSIDTRNRTALGVADITAGGRCACSPQARRRRFYSASSATADQLRTCRDTASTSQSFGRSPATTRRRRCSRSCSPDVDRGVRDRHADCGDVGALRRCASGDHRRWPAQSSVVLVRCGANAAWRSPSVSVTRATRTVRAHARRGGCPRAAIKDHCGVEGTVWPRAGRSHGVRRAADWIRLWSDPDGHRRRRADFQGRERRRSSRPPRTTGRLTELRRDLAARGRRRAEADYSQDVIAAKTLAFYREVDGR